MSTYLGIKICLQNKPVMSSSKESNKSRLVLGVDWSFFGFLPTATELGFLFFVTLGSSSSESSESDESPELELELESESESSLSD